MAREYVAHAILCCDLQSVEQIPLLLAEKEGRTFGQSRYLIRVISDQTGDFGSEQLITNNITGTNYTLFASIDDRRQELATIHYVSWLLSFLFDGIVAFISRKATSLPSKVREKFMSAWQSALLCTVEHRIGIRVSRLNRKNGILLIIDG